MYKYVRVYTHPLRKEGMVQNDALLGKRGEREKEI